MAKQTQISEKLDELVRDAPASPDAGDADAMDAASVGRRPWSQVWHLPVLVLGVALLLLSLHLSLPTSEPTDFAATLDEVALYLKAENLEKAQEQLEAVEQHLDDMPQAQKGRYYLYSGDLIYQTQRQKNLDAAENHRKIRRYYALATEKGQTLDGLRLQRLAETLVALGEDAAALKLVEQMQDEPAQRRYLVLKQILEARLSRPGVELLSLVPLLERFSEELRHETDLARRRAERIWTVGLRADAALAAGDPEYAIRHLLREMIKFSEQGGDFDLAPLMVRLAKAFARTGETAEARHYYQLAQQKLDRQDALNAHVLVGLAELALADTGNVEEALALFTEAASDYADTDFASPHHPIYVGALIGAADCQARRQLHGEALPLLHRATELLSENPHPPAAVLEQLAATVHAQHGIAYDLEDYQQALDYLAVLIRLQRPNLSPQLLAKLADTHDRIAAARLAHAARLDETDPTDPGSGREASAEPEAPGGGAWDEPLPPTAARRLANQEAAIHFHKAADYYHQHAKLQTMDDVVYASSLWKAAEAYDRAGLWQRAIDVWDQYVRTRAEDPRLLEAVHRLGMAHLAEGQHAEALRHFERLVEGHSRTPEAYASLTPLARCYKALERHGDAKRVLNHVTGQHEAITPDSEHYRDALVALGKLHYELKEFVPAIERLSEAVDRYGQTRQGPLLRYYLADAYRQSVSELDAALTEPLPQSKLLALRGQRADRLGRAQTFFGTAAGGLNQIPEAQRSALETLCLRNASFYQADCAYDLGQFDRAIRLYDEAAKRWEHDPASLVALVQIVNAYCELGNIQAARSANLRARDHLKRIPDTAFDDGDLPMSRKHWQDWLRWSSELNLFDTPDAAEPVVDRGG